jgi:hypothetical protein
MINNEELKVEQPLLKNPPRPLIRLLRPDLNISDFSRMLPKKMYQDKESLYSEGLHLKQKFNEVHDENVKLKTRVSVLKKEKDQLSRVIEEEVEVNRKSRLFKIRVGHASPVIMGLKRVIRETVEEKESLR